jgi:hypothetical protein
MTVRELLKRASAWLAERRSTRPERLARRAEADARRRDAKREAWQNV